MKFSVTNRIEEADRQKVYEGLRTFNQARRVGGESVDLAVYAWGEEGEMEGGLIGETHDNWLFVKFLWIREDLRGQGLGSALLVQAEGEAKKRGCRYAFLDTFDFQAPAFYPKHGYEVQFVLEEYPLTGKRYYFTKSL